MSQTLELTGGVRCFDWQITGLSNPFTTAYYIRAGIAKLEIGNGTESIPDSEIIGFENAKSIDYDRTETDVLTTEYEPGTYMIYGFAQARNELYYAAGSGRVTVQSNRIVEWDWQGSNGDATAEETYNFYRVVDAYNLSESERLPAEPRYLSHKVFNDLCAKIREARIAHGEREWSTSSFGLTYDQTLVSSGEKLSALKYNSMRYNLGSVYGTGINDVSPGDNITGRHFIQLTQKLNEYINS